ncbi:MAG: diguanylate cyclase [Candidatus Neomarinimicrobiota bacterium]
MVNSAKILILEDDPFFVLPIRYHLERAGYQVTALAVLENVETSQELIFQYSPNIILCDIQMSPNGFEILRLIKSHSQLRLIPFIFLTGVDSLPERIRAYLGGVDDFIIKPIDKEELLAKIGSILKRQGDLESAIYLDPLTQIHNRRYFEKELQRQVNLHRRHQDIFSMALLDIDHFKSINDTYGHNCGDQCLVAFSRFIQREIRSTDIFSRWGGEEFILIMERSDANGASKSLQYILDKMRSEPLMRYSSQDITITFSAGLAQYPDHGTDCATLMEAADKAVYRAKDRGRCRIELFETD